MITKALARVKIKSIVVEEIRVAQMEDNWCKQKIQTVQDGLESDFQVVDGVHKFRGRACVSLVEELR